MFCSCWFVSSEEWSKVGDMERGNLGITVADDGEFWWAIKALPNLNSWPLLSDCINECCALVHRMPFADWCKLFTNADVCRVINTALISVNKTWNEVVHFGSWTKNAEPLLNRCGGCANHKPTFLQNPQVHSPHIICVQAHVNVYKHTFMDLFSLTFFFYSTCLMLQRSPMRSWSPCNKKTWRSTDDLVKEKTLPLALVSSR